MSGVVRGLLSSGRERDELVAHVDESHRRPSPPTQLELEEASVPGQRPVDLADLESNIVDADDARHGRSLSAHGARAALPPPVRDILTSVSMFTRRPHTVNSCTSTSSRAWLCAERVWMSKPPRS